MVYSPLKFANRVIQDEIDPRPIRVRYFGVFTQKINNNKELKFGNMVNVLLDTNNIDDVFLAMITRLEFPISKKESAIKIIETARDDKDYDKIRMIYDAWLEYDK